MTLQLARQWILDQRQRAHELLNAFAEINSFTRNRAGLDEMAKEICNAYRPLEARMERIENPEAVPFLIFEKRPHASIQVLLGGHMDTVYPPSMNFSACKTENEKMFGPGVTDMKGGLIVLLIALQAFELFSPAAKIGWTVAINADEEIGSPSSRPIWKILAQRFDFGLLFEPVFPDGSFVITRNGSLNVLVEVKGRAAHAGRDFHEGRSSNRAMTEFLHEMYLATDKIHGVTMNAGELKGGSAANVVPSYTLCKINFRSPLKEHLLKIEEALASVAGSQSIKHEVEFTVTTESLTPPKENSAQQRLLFAHLEACCKTLSLPFRTVHSGGVCDGNALLENGLPNIDTMGVQGGCIHTEEEYVELESLITRAQLTLELLWRIESSEFSLPKGAETC